MLDTGDNVKNEVSVRYHNSKFLGHAAALDLIHKFNEGIKELNKRAIVADINGWSKCQLGIFKRNTKAL